MVDARRSPVDHSGNLHSPIDEAADGSHAYDLRLDVAFRNVGIDGVEVNPASGAGGSFAAPFPAETGYRLQGTFLGSPAKEASGRRRRSRLLRPAG